jgi:hydrogenase expression/formation protein HypE
MRDNDKILLGHGSGGQLSHELITELFVKYFSNPTLDEQTDSALVSLDKGLISFTTDSFVVDPIFFPGGDIGKLAVCGTVNDLAVSGAKPLYLSAGFIIEEGLPLNDLERIVASMANEAEKAGVTIVTGDTKVVDRGHCDKLFINTSGIGTLVPERRGISTGAKIKPGDKVIINGHVGDHGMAVMAAREELQIRSEVKSDCASLNHLIEKALNRSNKIRFMRDATRGGLATVIAELAVGKNYGIKLDEASIPVRESVRGFCELLGFDPLYVANEGKVVMIVDAGDADDVLSVMKLHEYGSGSCIIGEITTEYPGKSWIETGVGGHRVIDMMAGEQLPRIC